MLFPTRLFCLLCFRSVSSWFTRCNIYIWESHSWLILTNIILEFTQHFTLIKNSLWFFHLALVSTFIPFELRDLLIKLLILFKELRNIPKLLFLFPFIFFFLSKDLLYLLVIILEFLLELPLSNFSFEVIYLFVKI